MPSTVRADRATATSQGLEKVLSLVLDQDQLASLGYERLTEDDPDAQYS
ncbi:hypothetical protein ABZU76_09785 [Amycolatopsis sp. NPDC005232]